MKNLTEVLGGDVALTIVRVAISVGSAWTIYTLSKMLRRGQPRRSIVIVPRIIVLFALFWSVSTWLTATALMVVDAEAVAGPLRTWFGATLAWQLFGVAWVLAVGASGSLSALKAMEAIRSIVHDDGGDDDS